MGVLIIGETPNPSAGYDQWKVYKASTKEGSYSVIATQALTDLTYYDTAGTDAFWYKTTFYNAVGPVESDFSAPVRGLSTTYTSVAKVTSFLQIDVRSDSTTPTVAQITEIIGRIEDQMDNTTGHAWRLRYSGTKTGEDTTARYVYIDLDNPYEYATGVPLYLPDRMIRAMDATEGDEIGYFNGSTWEDWIADRTEGRADDFWFMYDTGIFYAKSMYVWRRPVSLRFKYRWGDEIVPRDIERAATLLASIDILSGMENKSVLVPEGSDALKQRDKIEMWQEQADNIIDRYKEFKMPIALM